MKELTKEQLINKMFKSLEDEEKLAFEVLEMKKMFEKGNLGIVVPLFHSSQKEIMKQKSQNNFIPDFNYFTLLKSVNLQQLINLTEKSVSKILNENILFHKKLNDEKTFKIFSHWQKHQPLIPPTIDSFKYVLRIDNGLHRINAAHYFGLKTIPIIIYKNQKSIIEKMLNG